MIMYAVVKKRTKVEKELFFLTDEMIFDALIV